jgi:hypothetical protein
MTVLTLPPSESVIRLYTNGYCAKLAFAIHTITGWKMKAIVADIIDFSDDDPLYRDWTHAFVEIPDGRMLDIEGLQTWQEMVNGPFGDGDCFQRNKGYVDDIYIADFPWQDMPSVNDIDANTIHWAKWAIALAENA